MLKDQLSNTISGEQFAISTFETPIYLQEKDQMSYALLTKKMKKGPEYWAITNEKLVKRDRFCEFLRIITQALTEFTEPYEVSRFFQHSGVDTRTGNLWEMYLEQENLLCNYCFQVNLAEDAPFFMRIKAFVKH